MQNTYLYCPHKSRVVASQITSVMHAFHDQSLWVLLTVGKLLDCGVCCCLKVYNSRQLVYNMFSFLPFIFQTCLYHFKDMLQFKHIELVSSGHWRTAMYPCKWGIVGKKKEKHNSKTHLSLREKHLDLEKCKAQVYCCL